MNELADFIDIRDIEFLDLDIGPDWDEFVPAIPEETTKQLRLGYNLIKLSFPECYLGAQLKEIILDENIETVEKIDLLRDHILTNIIDILQRIGLEFDEDYLNYDSIPYLNKALDLFFTLNNYEDWEGLSIILESSDIHPRDRFINLYRKFYLVPEEDELEDLLYMISNVSEVALESIKVSLIHPDLIGSLPDNIKERITNNKDFFSNTVGEWHIKHDGAIGGTLDALMKTHKQRLNDILEVDAFSYYKSCLSLLLICDLNNDQLPVMFQNLLSHIDDITVSMRIEKVYKTLVL